MCPATVAARLASAAIVLLTAVPRARANDAAAAIAAGGVVLREERRVAMRKERLVIRGLKDAPPQVEVEYEFVNESAEPVTTEVAFPVPEYSYAVDALEGPMDLGGFKAWVDGVEIPVTKQVRALVGDVDHAPVLRELGIDVERHGGYEPDEIPGRGPDQLHRLSRPVADRLIALGLLAKDHPDVRWPLWRVAITWHWTQTFRPGEVVRVRHAYTPAAGFSYSPVPVRDYLAGLPDACADAALVHTLEARRAAAPDAMVHGTWVRYILTTANTWKTPIRDFELEVERPAGHAVSFCWDGKVQKTSPTKFSARRKDFVPEKELAVYFFAVK